MRKITKRRWFMLLLLCLVIGINYLDRGNLAVAAPVMQTSLGINHAMMGLLFSAFAWSYAFCLPLAGMILDKVGPRILMTIAIIGWSFATLLMGFLSKLSTLMGARILLGIFEAPIIPSNIKCVAAWFPDKERAKAVGAYTATEYLALGLLAPVLSWILVTFSWHMIFIITGLLGLVVAIIWYRYYREPWEDAQANEKELRYIRWGGAVKSTNAESIQSVRTALSLCKKRLLLGMCIGQFSIMTTLFFFLTWFPSYLIAERGLTILKTGVYSMLPFMMAIVGSLLGGVWSDYLLRRGHSKTVARKLPIIIGFLLSMLIMGANYIESITGVIICMAVSFFGQAMASAVSGALLSDIAPKEAIGIAGGLLNFVANLGSATSPLVIGCILQFGGGFPIALAYVSCVALAGILAYVVLMGRVHRIEL
ncbi:MFS transporter [Veillonella montpellierensis]|uniref:MFS transporter n=1 Tax=Veillonella montpellierensis TaxID=187328 RepID=UPI0023F7BF7D|nr:MFS transporter [Veillonella montpellierensis]